jgi:hypothetical protein
MTDTDLSALVARATPGRPDAPAAGTRGRFQGPRSS